MRIESKAEQEMKIQAGSVAATRVLTPHSRILKKGVWIPLPVSEDYSGLYLKWLAAKVEWT